MYNIKIIKKITSDIQFYGVQNVTKSVNEHQRIFLSNMFVQYYQIKYLFDVETEGIFNSFHKRYIG